MVAKKIAAGTTSDHRCLWGNFSYRRSCSFSVDAFVAQTKKELWARTVNGWFVCLHFTRMATNSDFWRRRAAKKAHLEANQEIGDKELDQHLHGRDKSFHSQSGRVACDLIHIWS